MSQNNQESPEKSQRSQGMGRIVDASLYTRPKRHLRTHGARNAEREEALIKLGTLFGELQAYRHETEAYEETSR